MICSEKLCFCLFRKIDSYISEPSEMCGVGIYENKSYSSTHLTVGLFTLLSDDSICMFQGLAKQFLNRVSSKILANELRDSMNDEVSCFFPKVQTAHTIGQNCYYLLGR